MINPAVDDLAVHVGTARACGLLGRSRAGHYRAKNPPPPRARAPRPANKLTAAERAQVLAVLTSQRFADKSVAQVWATLLDEGTLCPGILPGQRGYLLVGDTGFEPVTSSVSRKRATTAPIARADDVVREVATGFEPV